MGRTGVNGSSRYDASGGDRFAYAVIAPPHACVGLLHSVMYDVQRARHHILDGIRTFSQVLSRALYRCCALSPP
jgi:hypothetical protein